MSYPPALLAIPKETESGVGAWRPGQGLRTPGKALPRRHELPFSGVGEGLAPSRAFSGVGEGLAPSRTFSGVGEGLVPSRAFSGVGEGLAPSRAFLDNRERSGSGCRLEL
jgi:hypothetical protein